MKTTMEHLKKYSPIYSLVTFILAIGIVAVSYFIFGYWMMILVAGLVWAIAVIFLFVVHLANNYEEIWGVQSKKSAKEEVA